MPTPLRIVVTEYPKCGGTWLVSMLGDVLDLPKRDIYVHDGYTAQNLTHHPWYIGAASLNLADSCIIKSHELPNSPLLDFPAHPARYLHLVRDGRDVVVSRYFFERDFCVQNGIYEKFDTPFDQYVTKIATDWANYVSAWLATSTPVMRYEQFLADPAASLRRAMELLNLSALPEQITAAVAANTKEKSRQKLAKAYAHNTFVRQATAGDWRNHFTPEHVERFNQAAGPLLIRLGYEPNADWAV